MKKVKWIVPTIYIIFLMLPIYWLLNMSFKTTTEIRFENFFSQFTFNNFFSIWDLEIRTNKNTFKQSLFSTILSSSCKSISVSFDKFFIPIFL